MSNGANSLKIMLALAIGAAIGTAAHHYTNKDNPVSTAPTSLELEVQAAASDSLYKTLYSDQFTPTGFAGNYLSGFFAQQHHDWTQANSYMKQSLQHDQDNADLLRRGIVLAIAAGEYNEANERAKILSVEADDDSIGQLYLTVESFKNNDDGQIQSHLAEMNKGGIADFVKPLLETWYDASKGELNTQNLRKNTIHLMHGVLASHHLKNKAQTENLLAEALALKGFTINDLQRAADIYADIGRIDKATEIYEQIATLLPAQISAKEKLQKLKSGEPIEPYDDIKNAQDGVGVALFDMAKLFYQEGADDSAHIFAHMSLSLNKNNTDAFLLLADIAARNGRYDEAVAYYNNIGEDHAYYLRTQRQIADLLEENGQLEEAIKKLEYLAAERNDLTALIQIGDIYRRENEFVKAIEAYDRAEKKIGKDNVIPDYWHLYYVRGMAYERNGNWDMAEKDLQAALDFKPDHPFVLNYLGYAWADQNKNLEKATEMIKKAVMLQPDDGYITDSLGWVYYRTGQYQDAVEHLERAVELLPYDPVINDHLGDAYWKVGRKLEAKFQWERAKNNIEDGDETLLATLNDKLENGMSVKTDETFKRADTQIEEDKKIQNP